MKAYSKYKSSGIEWLGEILTHWKLSKLKYYVNISIFKEGPTVLLGRKGPSSSLHWAEGKYCNVDTEFDTRNVELYNKLSEDRVNMLFKQMWFNELYDTRVRGIR